MLKRYMAVERSPFEQGSLLSGLAFLFFSVWLLFASVAGAADVDGAPLIIHTGGGDRSVQVELALTDAERMRGLMFRENLAPATGMLFVWPEERLVRMWMKNTLIPLDMVFLDDGGRVVHIERNTVPHDLTPRGPEEQVLAVLELAGGEAARLGISPGDQITHPALPGQTN